MQLEGRNNEENADSVVYFSIIIVVYFSITIYSTMSDLWHNNVLTVLVEICQKNMKGYATSFIDGSGTSQQNDYTTDLQNKINGWIDRLSIYLNNAFASGAVTPAMRVAETIREQLHKSLPIVSQPTSRRRNSIQNNLDENNRPFFSMLGAISDIQAIQRQVHRLSAILPPGGSESDSEEGCSGQHIRCGKSQ